MIIEGGEKNGKMLNWTGKSNGENRVSMTLPKKIILILIDTLRADHLGCYGYKRNTSPNIDTFAKEGILFKWPFAPISYTVPSITSLFTGKYPSNHCTMFSNVSSLVIGKVRKVAITSGFKSYNDEMTAHELNRLNKLIRSGDKTNEL